MTGCQIPLPPPSFPCIGLEASCPETQPEHLGLQLPALHGVSGALTCHTMVGSLMQGCLSHSCLWRGQFASWGLQGICHSPSTAGLGLIHKNPALRGRWSLADCRGIQVPPRKQRTPSFPVLNCTANAPINQSQKDSG